MIEHGVNGVDQPSDRRSLELEALKSSDDALLGMLVPEETSGRCSLSGYSQRDFPNLTKHFDRETNLVSTSTVDETYYP